MQINILQQDNTALGRYYQLKLPLKLDACIPANEPVRLLSAFVEDLSLKSESLRIKPKALVNNASVPRIVRRICISNVSLAYIAKRMLIL